MIYLSYLAAGIFIVLGLLHLLFTMKDWLGEPAYFVPANRQLLKALQSTQLRFSPTPRTYWEAMVGFHASHSVAAMMVGLTIMVAEAYAIPWLVLLNIGVSALYVFLAWRFWFYVPFIACCLAFLLQIARVTV